MAQFSLKQCAQKRHKTPSFHFISFTSDGTVIFFDECLSVYRHNDVAELLSTLVVVNGNPISVF